MGELLLLQAWNPFNGKLIAWSRFRKEPATVHMARNRRVISSEYRIMTVNGYYRVPPLDVVQIRYMMDPVWPIYGMTPLMACFPEACSRHFGPKA